MLYIVLFLHQTTTPSQAECLDQCCISYYSYIKPQLYLHLIGCRTVVYRTIPTSNHNVRVYLCVCARVVYRTIPTSNHNESILRTNKTAVVYRTIPTSNHNLGTVAMTTWRVVYRTIPTSNHNCQPPMSQKCMLYIVLFLHQTTTSG